MNTCGNKGCPYQCNNKCVASGLCAGFEPVDEINENISILHETGKIKKPNVEEAIQFCNTSNIGEYKCSVKTRYGWCCDLCLEAELLTLNNYGIHTVNSCCGHGNPLLSNIMVIGENSIESMDKMGYVVADIQADRTEHVCLTKCYIPKSTMLYEKHDEPSKDTPT